MRGLSRTPLVNLDYTTMTLAPREYHQVQVGVRLPLTSVHSWSPSFCHFYNFVGQHLSMMGELMKGLMEGAAEPGQIEFHPEDKQQKKMKEIQVEVDLAKRAMEDTVMKIQERGQKLDHLQDQTGQSFFLSSMVALSSGRSRGLINSRWEVKLT